MDRKITLLLFVLIFFLGTFLRFYKLGTVPHGYHQDEVANAYVGKYIFINGVDLYGNRPPLLYFDKTGDYPPVIPMYISALGTFVLGNTPLATRFPSAIIATLALLPMFFIARHLLRSDKAGLIAMLLLATAPWHVGFSRTATEGTIALTVYLYGFLLFFIAFRKRQWQFAFLGTVLFLSTYLLYPGYRLLVSLTLGLLYIYFGKKADILLRKLIVISLGVSTVLTAYISTTVWGQGRYAQTSILAYLDHNNIIGGFTANENNVILAHIFNNKPLYFVREFLIQFSAYLNPSYLFLQGGYPKWFSIPNTGLVPFALLITICVGSLISSRFQDKSRTLFFSSLLIIATIIPAALTIELSPHTHRSLPLLIPIILIATYSFMRLSGSIHRYKKILLTGIGLVWVVEFILFTHNYFQHVSMYTAVSRSDANTKMSLYLRNNRSNYDRIYMLATGWMPAYYLFFTNNYDRHLAGTFQRNFRLPMVDNIRFIDADCIKPDIENLIITETKNMSRILFVMSTTCTKPSSSFKEIAIVDDVVGTPIYRVFKMLPRTVIASVAH